MGQELMTTQPARVAGPTGMTRRQEFGASEMTTRNETSASVLAAGAAALIQARFIMALQRPRDLDDVRAKILRECERPSFAEAAWYTKPIGKGTSGLSIRFAEAALRMMGNVTTEAITVYEDEIRRTVRVTLVDLETNASYSKDVVVEKTVERNSVKDGQRVLGQRQNSKGMTTYLVEASEDEMLAKEGALVSKAIRTLGLRLLPGDIAAEAEEAILRTRENRAAQDPDLERKRMADGFAGLGILPSQLKDYLGKDLAQTTPAELTALRDLYRSLRSGEMTWADTLAEARVARGEGEAAEKAKRPIAERVKAAAQPPPTAPAAPPAPASEPPAPTILPADGVDLCSWCDRPAAYADELHRPCCEACSDVQMEQGHTLLRLGLAGEPAPPPPQTAKQRAEARRRREPGEDG